jgi:hypothetical protein
MDLSKIISVAGKSGLFRVVAQGRQAVIAESLLDGKRIAVPSSAKVSSLEEISMFTTGDDVPLKEVLQRLYEVENGKESLDPKESDDKLFAKLGEALPTHDRERIYASDVRKLFSWYQQLLKAGDFVKIDDAKPDADGAEKTAKAKAPKEGDKKVKGESVKKAATGSKPTTSKAKATTMRKSAQRGA